MNRLRQRVFVTLVALGLCGTLAQPNSAYGQDLLNDNPTFSPFNLELRPYVTMPAGSNNIISMTTRGGDPRLYVTTQEGLIHVINSNPTGSGTAATWFDVRTVTTISGSSSQFGLQSVAFHPEFDNAGMPGYGKFYTTMIRTHASNGAGPGIYLGNSPQGASVSNDCVLAEFTYNHAAGTFGDFRELFRVNMPLYDHPIKQARFNPYAEPGDEDYGLLYVSHGDSTSQDSPGDYPQLLGNALGKMIRINPLAAGGDRYTIPTTNPFADSLDPGVLKEIYAYGFRNPHTFSFNRDDSGDVHLLLGNIGRTNVEEIELVTAGSNYGWPKREGTFVEKQLTNETPNAGYITGVSPLPANEASVVDAYGNGNSYPVAQYDHNALVSQVGSGNAVASGFVIRNGSDPNLHNQLIFNNFANHDGVVYHADFDDMLAAVTTLDPLDPARDEPGELTQAVLHKLNLALDHDSNPATAAQLFSDLNTMLGRPRNDARYGEGVFGEMYVSTKQNGGRIYLVTNSVPLAGDYNKDRVVDAADYVMWRDTAGGEGGYHLPADGNGDGQVDEADYAVWQSNFGKVWSASGSASGAATAIAVPEPTAFMLVGMGMVALLAVRRGKSQR
jgi:hypothetical protein